MRLPFHSRILWLFAAVTASLAVGGIAYATIPDQNGVIHGCRNDGSGVLRVIDADTSSCLQSETALDWNVSGPQGEPGPEGPSDGFASVRRSVPVPNEQGEVASLSLPEGQYVLNASLFVNNNSSTRPAVLICSFSFPAAMGGVSALALKPFVSGEVLAAGTLAMTNGAQLFSPQSVSVLCTNNVGPEGNAEINTIQFTAVKVATLSVQ
jgi:hypothetical protein